MRPGPFFQNLGRMDVAAERFELAASLSPGNVTVLNNLGVCQILPKKLRRRGCRVE